MSSNDSNNKYIVLLAAFCIVILLILILIINVDFMKYIVLFLFKNKNNAYEYLQFSGIFLGIIGAIAGLALVCKNKE